MKSSVVGSLRAACLAHCLMLILLVSCKPMQEEEDTCLKMCKWLADCGLCLNDPQKNCRSVDNCHTYCQSKPSLQSAARCILNLPNCDKAAVNVCLAGGGKKDSGVVNKDGAGGKKDTGGGKDDAGGGYYPKTDCHLAFEKLNATVLTVNDDGTSSTFEYKGDYDTGLFGFSGSPIPFYGPLKNGHFKGTIQGYYGYKGTLEFVFDHAADKIVSFKQDYWISSAPNGPEVWDEHVVLTGGGGIPTKTTINSGSIDITRAAPTGTALCKHLSAFTDEVTDPKNKEKWKTARVTKWSCSSKSYIRFHCFYNK